MSSRIMNNRPKCLGVNTKIIAFKFFPEGVATTALVVQGDSKLVTSVIRTATAGEYTVTMADAYRRVVITPTLQLAAGVDQKLQLGAVTNESTSTPLVFVIRCIAVAAASDIAANANNAIHVQILVNDSSAEE